MIDNIEIRTTIGLHNLPFEKKFKILGYTFNQAGRMQDSLDERMQSASTAWWRNVKIYRSNDVPQRVKCRRRVEQVCSVILFRKQKLVLE